jgi:hypothetical protein
MSRLGPPSSKEFVIEAIVRDPAILRKATLIPFSAEGGRPRRYPNWVHILCNELVSHFQTAGRVMAELADPRTWAFVCELAAELFPSELQPPLEPIRWHHFKYIKNTYLARDDILAEYRLIHREEACALAREAGNFPERGPASTIHPTEAITIAADGKVVATRTKARPGERRKDRAGKWVPRRVDPDKDLYHEGDQTDAWGLKFNPLHTRTPFGRVVLDIPYVRGVSPKDEADVTLQVLRELRALLPGPLFHVHDGAMTSEHDQAMLTDLGIILINRPKAKSNPNVRGASIGQRKPDEGLVEIKTVKHPDGTKEMLRIHQRDGELGLLELTQTGESLFVRLQPTKLIMNSNRKPSSRRFRPYIGLRLPPEIALRTGKREIIVALYQTSDDEQRGYRRTAHVRAIGPGNKRDFAMYRRMRGDSESLNRAVEDSLYRHHRAHSEGWACQQVDMLGLAGLINAITRERMRRARLAGAA